MLQVLLKTSVGRSAGHWRAARPYLYRHHPAAFNYLAKTNTSLYNNSSIINDNVLIIRNFSIRPALFELNKDSSKVETAVKAMKEASERKEKALTADPQVTAVPAEPPKRSLTKRIWDEVVHYYHGFRLLFIDIGIASRLLWKVLNGISLSRREHKQLVRTSSDVFRLVPFSVFIIIPFMELLLPVFLKFFPNLLPSTFATASEKVNIVCISKILTHMFVYHTPGTQSEERTQTEA